MTCADERAFWGAAAGHQHQQVATNLQTAKRILVPKTLGQRQPHCRHKHYHPLICTRRVPLHYKRASQRCNRCCGQVHHRLARTSSDKGRGRSLGTQPPASRTCSPAPTSVTRRTVIWPRSRKWKAADGRHEWFRRQACLHSNEARRGAGGRGRECCLKAVWKWQQRTVQRRTVEFQERRVIHT